MISIKLNFLFGNMFSFKLKKTTLFGMIFNCESIVFYLYIIAIDLKLFSSMGLLILIEYLLKSYRFSLSIFHLSTFIQSEEDRHFLKIFSIHLLQLKKLYVFFNLFFSSNHCEALTELIISADMIRLGIFETFFFFILLWCHC